MSKINIAKIMIPKACTRVIHTSDTVRQALEILECNGYTAIPVVDKAGGYAGTITEGDFLRHIMQKGNADKKYHEQFLVEEIFRRDFCPAISITADTENVVREILNQNFLPVVDDRNILCGIVTRKSIIAELVDYEE